MNAFLNGLSTLFLAPVHFWFLGLIPVVILLYLLKLRRTEVVIPSTMLWLKSLQDLTANAPFQRLRKNLLLLLQILVLLLLVFGLARPFVKAEGTRGENLCVVIDRSASMECMEKENKTRLELAKERALDLIEDMESGDRMMLVSFAESAEVLCELTDDRGRLRAAVEGIQTEDTRSNIRDVTMIVRSLAPDNPDVPSVVSDLEILLISDGNLSDLDELGQLSLDISFIRIGETRHNAGIVAFSTRKPPEGQGARQAFVLVHNENISALQSTLSLYFNGGNEDSLLAVEEIDVPPGETGEMVFELPHVEQGLLRAELDVDDMLAVDNKAWLALRPEAYIRVLLVDEADSMGGYFLRRVLGLEPRVELSSVTPAEYTGSEESDLTIFDGWAPGQGDAADNAKQLPAGTLLFINAVPPALDVKTAGTLDNPPVLATEKDHPVMRFLNPGNVRVGKALQVELPSGARTLISTTNGPLVADVSRAGQQMLLVTFDLGDSNWPLHLSFPLFVQNLLAWTPRSGLAQEGSIATGKSIELLADVGVEEARVTLPDKTVETVNLDPLRPVSFGDTARAGPYKVERGTATEWYAVNLLDRNETAVAPAESLKLGKAEVAAVEGPIRFDREFWRWLLAAGLGVLCLEWWIYSRRAWL